MTVKGGHHTEETKQRIREAKRKIKNRPPLKPQLCACGCGGLTTVDERRYRAPKYISGHNAKVAHPMKGKHHTGEAKAKLASYAGDQASSFKHGWSNTPTYWSWSGMLSRCRDPRNASFKYYGGQGITVCERWREFKNFLADMGERPDGKTLDRIDNTRGYEPGNCRWATRAEQNANQRNPGGWIKRRANQD